MGTARPNATLLAQSFGMFCNRYPLASGYCLGEAGSSDTGVGELQRKFALMFALPNLFFFFFFHVRPYLEIREPHVPAMGFGQGQVLSEPRGVCLRLLPGRLWTCAETLLPAVRWLLPVLLTK